jgi:hypothetical protein
MILKYLSKASGGKRKLYFLVSNLINDKLLAKKTKHLQTKGLRV